MIIQGETIMTFAERIKHKSDFVLFSGVKTAWSGSTILADHD